MTDSGIFGWIWRFNAVAIALAASGAIVALLMMFVAIGMTFLGDRRWQDDKGLVDRDAAQADNVSYSLGHAEEAEGTSIVIHTLDRERREPRALPIKSAYSYDRDVVNLLVVDDAAANGRWMFEGARQTIYARSFIYDPATLNAPRGERQVSAMLIHLSHADTNKDGIIDARDDSALLMYKLADGSRQVLIKGSLSLNAMRQAADGRVLVMYEEGEKTILAGYDASDFRLLAKNELPRLSTAQGAAP